MDNYQINKQQNNDCILRGICAQNPSLTYMQEIISSYLQELAYYLLKLKELGVTNEQIKENILEVVSSLVIGLEYSPDQFYKIINNISSDLSQAKSLYINMSKQNNVKFDMLKSSLKNVKNNISQAINQGQILFSKKQSQRTEGQKKYFETISVIIKSLCIHIVELKSLNEDETVAYDTLLRLFNIMNMTEITEDELDEIMHEFVDLDKQLLMALNEARQKNYGKITPTEVSTSTRPNKAILVSGTNLRELELILNATKGKGIDIYTHGHMIMAHSFPKLRAYPNLVGHFGGGIESYLLDFAEFPGVILMTKHSFHRVEKLYRCRIYTTDILAPKGVIMIKNENFEPLIQSALCAEGFTQGTQKPPINLTLDEEKILKKIEQVAEKVESGEIKHFITIGVTNHSKPQKDYFENLIKLVEPDTFVLSFTSVKDSENVLHVESDYGFPLIYKAFEILTRRISMEELDLTMFFTRCEPHTLSNILNMKYMGVNKLYFNDCPPALINPSIIESIRQIVHSKKYSNPHQDMKEILEGNNSD